MRERIQMDSGKPRTRSSCSPPSPELNKKLLYFVQLLGGSASYLLIEKLMNAQSRIKCVREVFITVEFRVVFAFVVIISIGRESLDEGDGRSARNGSYAAVDGPGVCF